MRYFSLFSGIEAASQAWIPLGWECVGVSEIDKFACRLLKHYYPDVPNLGDITQITPGQIEALKPIDLVVGGFPCQDVSVAGHRKGLEHDGEATRSGLFYDMERIAGWSGARFVVCENVPGLLSSKGGRDFADVVGTLAGLRIDVPESGWQNTGACVGPAGLVEWSVLDSQYFCVAQRRERVFVIRDSGDWFNRPPILFDAESVSGNTPASRKTGQEITGTLAGHTSGGGSLGTGFDFAGGLRFAMCLNGGGVNRIDAESETLITVGPLCRNEKAAGSLTLQDFMSGHCVVHTLRGEGFDASEDGCGMGTPLVTDRIGVRRLMPIECERLQAFPDNYTAIPGAKDSPRYKALGNSMTVSVMRWIGERIMDVTKEV